MLCQENQSIHMSEMICIQVLYEHTKTLDMNNVDNHGPQIVLNKDRKHLIQRVYECIFLEVKKHFGVFICNPSSVGVLGGLVFFFPQDFNVTVL